MVLGPLDGSIEPTESFRQGLRWILVPVLGLLLALHSSQIPISHPFASSDISLALGIASALWLVDLCWHWPLTGGWLIARTISPLILFSHHLTVGTALPWPPDFWSSPWHLALVFGLLQGWYFWTRYEPIAARCTDPIYVEWWGWVMIAITTITWATLVWFSTRLAHSFGVSEMGAEIGAFVVTAVLGWRRIRHWNSSSLRCLMISWTCLAILLRLAL